MRKCENSRFYEGFLLLVINSFQFRRKKHYLMKINFSSIKRSSLVDGQNQCLIE